MDIEFRAWGIEEKEMYYNVEKTYDNMTPPFVHINFGEMIEDKNYILEQYIGVEEFVDGKLGEKLHEGDKVRMDLDETVVDGVIEREGAACYIATASDMWLIDEYSSLIKHGTIHNIK